MFDKSRVAKMESIVCLMFALSAHPDDSKAVNASLRNDVSNLLPFLFSSTSERVSRALATFRELGIR